jgi:hypothetical protein
MSCIVYPFYTRTVQAMALIFHILTIHFGFAGLQVVSSEAQAMFITTSTTVEIGDGSSTMFWHNPCIQGTPRNVDHLGMYALAILRLVKLSSKTIQQQLDWRHQTIRGRLSPQAILQSISFW